MFEKHSAIEIGVVLILFFHFSALRSHGTLAPNIGPKQNETIGKMLTYCRDETLTIPSREARALLKEVSAVDISRTGFHL